VQDQKPQDGVGEGGYISEEGDALIPPCQGPVAASIDAEEGGGESVLRSIARVKINSQVR
jgi:hypothetical protein